MKLQVKQLSELVRAIVSDEVKKILPSVIRECLTEQYLKKIVSEQSKKTPKLTEELEEDDSEIPTMLANSNKGIYNDSPLAKGTSDKEKRSAKLRPKESLSKLLDANNPLNFIYEDVDSLPKDPTTGLMVGEGVPIEKMGGDFSKMKELLEGMERSTIEKKVGVKSVKTEERRFDPRLDTPISQQQEQPRRRPNITEAYRNAHPNIDGEVFPSAPIVLED